MSNLFHHAPQVDEPDWPACRQTVHEANAIRCKKRKGMHQLRLPGVSSCVIELIGGAVMLHNLQVPKPLQGKGHGSNAMEEIKKIARTERKPILLTFSPDDGQEDRLRRFYRRHGFRFLSDNVTMRWSP